MLYNILIYPSAINSVLDKVTKLSNNTNSSQYELELKFKTNKNEFLDIISYLQTVTNLQISSTSDTVYSYNKDKFTIRKVVGKNNIEYMSKERIVNADISLKHSATKQIDYRLGLAIESSINKNDFDDRLVNHIRKRNRTSFTLDNSFRADLSEVTTTLSDGKNINRTTYEVEIEYLSLPNKLISLDIKDKYRTFSEEFKRSLNLLFPNSHTLVSKDYEKYNELFSILQQHNENKPVNIQDKYLPSLVTNGISNYSVTNKLDGTKYNLFVVIGIDDKVQNLLLLNNTDIWLLYDNVAYKDISLKSKNTIYALDVEIIELERNNRKLVDIFIFDTIFSKNGKMVLDKTHFERLDEIKIDVLEQINKIDVSKTNFKTDFHIQKKTFIYEDKLQTSIQKIVKLMWSTFKTIQNVEEMNDGIIFQPIHTSYFKDVNKPILKWKFPEKVSIDFLVKKSSNINNLYNVYVYNDAIDSLEEFKYKGRVYYLYSENAISDNTIIETKFDTNRQHFTVYRYRYDKSRPNAIRTALDTFKDMIEPFLLKKIIDYLDGKIELITEPEEVEEVKTVFQNTLLDCDKPLIEQLFLLPKNINIDTCKLQLSFEAKKYKIGWKSAQSMITEINNILSNIGKTLDRTTILDAYAYSGCESFIFATGKLARGERPQKFRKIISFESDEVNYNSFINNLNVYNKLIFANEPYKRFENLKIIKSDFIKNYKETINELDVNIIYINNPSFSDIREFCINVFKTSPKVDLIVFKTYPTMNYKNIGLNYDLKYGILYVPKCLNVYRKIHNEIKNHVITEYCNKAKILDLGAGKGGDLFKYNSNNNIQIIYLVEPNEDNIKELNDRISKLQTSKTHDFDLAIIKAGSQDTKKIVDSIQQIQSNSTVDVITSFFSLTFLFQSESLLDSLVDTIDKTLSKNGYFVGTVMDGYRTLELLKTSNGYVYDNCYTIKYVDKDGESGDEVIRKNLVSKVKPNSYGKKIEIDLKGTETATIQSEYLVFLDLLEEKLNKKDIFLVNSPYFDDPSIEDILKNYSIDDMPTTEQRLNSLYRYFVFKRKIETTKVISENIIQILPSLTNYIEPKKDHFEFTSNVKDISFITSIENEGKDIYTTINKYARVGTIGSDNNCFFHSLLISNDFENYNKLDYSQRIECADKLRQQVVGYINPTIFEDLNYGMISYPKMVKNFYQNLNLLLIRGKIPSDNEYELKALDKFFKDSILNFYKQNTNFTHRITIVIERFLKLIENTSIQYKENMRNLIFDAGIRARNDSYKNYINSLLEKVDGKYVKDIDNEDIQYISAILGQQVIIINDKTNYPMMYMSFNPN